MSTPLAPKKALTLHTHEGRRYIDKREFDIANSYVKIVTYLKLRRKVWVSTKVLYKVCKLTGGGYIDKLIKLGYIDKRGKRPFVHYRLTHTRGIASGERDGNPTSRSTKSLTSLNPSRYR